MRLARQVRLHWRGSLRLRLLAVWAAVIVVSTLLLLNAAARERQRLVELAERDVLSMVELLAREDEQLLERSRVLLRVLASVPEVAEGAPAECNAFLWRSLERHPGYLTFGVANEAGEVICSAHRAGLGLRVSDRDYFQQTRGTRGFTVGSYLYDRTTGEASIHFGYPIFDEAGGVRRVLFAALNLRWLDGFAEKVSLPTGSRILAWDREGTVLAGYPREEWIGQNLAERSFIQESFRGERGTVTVTNQAGQSLLFAFTRLTATERSPPLYLGVGVPRETLLDASRRGLRAHLLVLWGTGIAGGLLLLFGVWWWVVRPLRDIEDAARALGRGHLDARTDVNKVASDEVTRLASTFDVMASAVEASEREREEFILLAAHELKTPLTTLKLHLQRALASDDRGGALPEPMRQRLQAAERQTWRLAHLVETILDAEALFEERLPIEPSRFDLSEVVRNVARRIEPSFRAAGCQLLLDLESPVAGVWDRALVARMLDQLLSNALKFGQLRPVVVRLRQEAEGVELTVQDFGLGIDSKDQERVFERFERAVSSRHHGGLGLGLWVVRELAHRMGGEVSLSSGLGMGARFSIRLPRTVREGRTASAASEAGGAAAP